MNTQQTKVQFKGLPLNFFSSVLGTEPRTLSMLGKCCTTELYLQLP